jgi:hypothetical protein
MPTQLGWWGTSGKNGAAVKGGCLVFTIQQISGHTKVVSCLAVAIQQISGHMKALRAYTIGWQPRR